MLFQWSHAHIARFFVVKNRTIKRGLERKNRVIKKSRYVCHGTNTAQTIGELSAWYWGELQPDSPTYARLSISQ